MSSPIKSVYFNLLGIARHRLETDGDGVTTLVGGIGCPLNCKYCLNPQCHISIKPLKLTADELYERIKIDSLYFEATGGGVTFGGGEPLLQAKFIIYFIKLIRAREHNWRICIETSLAVPLEAHEIIELSQLVDRFIIDVKDMNPDIYRAYTGCEITPMRANLERFTELAPDKIHVRLPLIPSFNMPADVDSSAFELEKMGIIDIERFVYSTNIRK
ncbi:MAG: radical SAM protein [Clostridiales bacterium]|nr:radical SAM protein [Clostridiales bacterium]